MSGATQPTLITGITSPRGQRSGAKWFWRLAPVILGASLLFQAGTALAVPREPWPPLPEWVQWLHHESFDQAYRDGMTNAQVALNGCTFEESWSG